jgi:DNA gyrase/topoisomerase IV subunit B
VGVSVVNALSKRVLVEIDRDGDRYSQEFVDGGKPKGKLGKSGKTPGRGRTTGTTIQFWPDPTIFQAEGVEFHFIGNQAPNFKEYWEPIMVNLPLSIILKKISSFILFLQLCIDHI